MDVMAACLSAVMRMRPDPEWKPPIGRLIVRIMHAPWQNEVVFCFREGKCEYRNLARVRDWRGEPYFGGCVECARGDMDTAGSGAAIVRRFATEDDIEALAKLWVADTDRGSFRCTLAEWLDRVGETSLCDEDKAMIARVVAARKAAP